MRLYLLLAALSASFVSAAPSKSLACRASRRASGTPSIMSTAWYPGWTYTTSPVSNISWSKYNLVTYAFATTTADPSVLGLSATDLTILPDFVAQAKSHGVKASISIGGWSGSAYFSPAVTSQNRTTFVKAILDMATKFRLDGVDFDWEAPNSVGAGNQYSGADSDNFLALLQELRAQPAGKGLYLTAAVGNSIWNGADGKPVADLSGFAKVLDHIAIMNYDINAQYSNATGVGPDAPLDDSCAKVQNGSGLKAIKAWTAAGFPTNKTLLGVPAYGHSYTVLPADALDASGNLTDHPKFTKSTTDDTKTFADLITQGFLNENGTATSTVKYRWDNCSKTPFVYDKTKQLMVSYDDPKSFTAKGNFITQNKLLGFAMWDSRGDHKDVLLDSIKAAVGGNQRDC